ncbi:hypothetical protein EATA6166_44920 (plasmid) [Enterobacter asburiae]|nr:hypothetical protein EAS17NKHM_p10770 [Enterobacter asburiae]BEK76600.1 hypothetical protein EATA6166_44920 [Enterobacter asburiae]
MGIQTAEPATPRQDSLGQKTVYSLYVLYAVFGRTMTRFPERYGPGKAVYSPRSKSAVMNITFNKLLLSPEAHGLVDWSATALDGSNIRALIRCAARAKKNILISPEIVCGVALAVVLAQNQSSDRRKRTAVKYRAQHRTKQRKPVRRKQAGLHWCSAPEKRRGHAVLADKVYSVGYVI